MADLSDASSSSSDDDAEEITALVEEWCARNRDAWSEMTKEEIKRFNENALIDAVVNEEGICDSDSRIKMLLAMGVDVTCVDEREGSDWKCCTALSVAVSLYLYDVVELLLGVYGIDIHEEIKALPKAMSKLSEEEIRLFNEGALVDAAREGDLDHLKDFLAIGINANAFDERGHVDTWGGTALHAATGDTAMHYDIVEHLVSVEGIDIDRTDKTCTLNGNTPLIQAMQETIGWREAEATDIAKLLIRAGADVNEIENKICQKSERSVLGLAALHGNTDIVKLILADPGRIDLSEHSPNQSALAEAARNGHSAIVELLLAVPGVRVNAQSLKGVTALHLAAEKGHTGVVKLLLAAPGIELGRKNMNDYSALHQAALMGQAAVIELLLAAPGINVGAKAIHSNTALHVAAMCNHTSAVELLLGDLRVDHYA